MERSEPTLVPEWLKGTGSISGGGSTSHHSASSSLHSDDHAVTLPTRNRSSSLSFGDYDNPRSSAFSDRTSSSYFRRSSSSNGSMAHGKDPVSYSRSYSSFGRSHRDKDWEKDLLDFPEKERSGLGDHRDRDYSDSVSASVLTSRIEKDALRRSQSMISAKRGDLWPKRMGTDSNNVKNNSHNTNNGVNVGGAIISNNQKTAFLERDFPSLGAEERQGATDIGRVSSPVLGTAVQSLQMGTSAVLSEGWTSALVEVPVMIGSNNMGLSSAQQTSPASSATSVPSITTGRNMAETLAQAPSRARTAPQLSVETQRLEELAIKQSRQLIPVTPSMPKASALTSEKPKPKPVARMGEMSMANKIGQQQQLISSQLANHSQHGGPVRSDVVPKTSVGGKLLVLKPAREKNGISPATNGSSPTNASKVANNPLTTASSVALTSPNSTNLASAQRKGSLVPVTLASSVEKKPTPSHAQSRNDFFNSMRKKTSTNHSSPALQDPPVASTAVMKKSGEVVTEVGAAPVSPQGSDAPLSDSSGVDWSAENGGDGGDVGSNGNPYDESQGFPDSGDDHSIPDAIVYPDEKEAAFLRSLGWDENEEGGGLTTEEINSFYKSVQCMELRPSLKLCRGSHQLKLKSLLGSQGGNLDSNSPSGLNPSNSKS